MIKSEHDIEGNKEIKTESDQTVVYFREKGYTGSSATVWLSEQIEIVHEEPQLFETKTESVHSKPIRKYCRILMDKVNHFSIATTETDLKCASKGDEFLEYEVERLNNLKKSLAKLIRSGQI